MLDQVLQLSESSGNDYLNLPPEALEIKGKSSIRFYGQIYFEY